MGLRIIGGELKGKKLHTLRGNTVRPTSDRLRESIFNILSFGVKDTVVLDLFAGTGALGIEALSRGATSAVFIEHDRHTRSLIEKNVTSCKINDRATIIKWDITKNLNCIQSTRPAFDLVFMDPPYNRNIVSRSLLNLHHSGSLKSGACIVVEHTLREPLPEGDLMYRVADQRKYGKTVITFLNYKHEY